MSVDSTTVRAHHDAAGMHLEPDALAALERAAEEAEKARQKGEARRNKTGRTTRNGKSGGASDAGASSA
ncbi:hypothetical protein GCM10010302_09750 [Streptomyces polychromogenes]|uniref:Uncharacterized protein n=1 Tax=Streptomyces polychromogenes TaxID=67342 RepID=A0ABP3EQJ2_9ACTN